MAVGRYEPRLGLPLAMPATPTSTTTTSSSHLYASFPILPTLFLFHVTWTELMFIRIHPQTSHKCLFWLVCLRCNCRRDGGSGCSREPAAAWSGGLGISGEVAGGAHGSWRPPHLGPALALTRAHRLSTPTDSETDQGRAGDDVEVDLLLEDDDGNTEQRLAIEVAACASC